MFFVYWLDLVHYELTLNTFCQHCFNKCFVDFSCGDAVFVNFCCCSVQNPPPLDIPLVLLAIFITLKIFNLGFNGLLIIS